MKAGPICHGLKPRGAESRSGSFSSLAGEESTCTYDRISYVASDSRWSCCFAFCRCKCSLVEVAESLSLLRIHHGLPGVVIRLSGSAALYHRPQSGDRLASAIRRLIRSAQTLGRMVDGDLCSGLGYRRPLLWCDWRSHWSSPNTGDYSFDLFALYWPLSLIRKVWYRVVL